MGERKYLQGFLPEIYLEGGDGTEELWIRYKDEEKSMLIRQEREGTVFWLLPEDIKTDGPFQIILKEGFFEQNFWYEITCPLLPGEIELRKRNNLGEECKEETCYIAGNEPEGIDTANLLRLPVKNEQFYHFSAFSAYKEIYSKGDLLADWLYFKGHATKLQFYEVFDHLFYWNNQEYGGENNDRKRYALNWLHYAGFVDYDYRSGRVTALPPALIALPAENRPNRFLLIGSRPCRMLQSIARFCEKHRKYVRLGKEQQDGSLRHLLLPDAVVIEATGEPADGYGLRYISELAEELGLTSSIDMQLQAKLVAFAPSIKDFIKTESYLELDEFHQTVKKLYFDRQRFVFTDSKDRLPEDNLILAEFQLNKWSTEYGIIKREGTEEKVRFLNKNWGRYFILEHYCNSCSEVYEGAKNTGLVFYDNARQCLAVRAEVPLPEFLNKAVIFLSGYLPAREKLLLNGHTNFYYIYRDCPPAFIRAIFLIKMNIVLEPFVYERSHKIV